MDESPNRIACPKCGAANFPSSANCWQCGEALRRDEIRVERVESEQPAGPPEPVPGAPPPPSPVYVPPTNRQDTETLVIVGFLLAVMGLFGCCCCCSWAFSIAAIVLGAIAYSKGDGRGLWVIIAGAAGLILGTVLNFVSLPFQRQFKGPWPGGRFPGPIPGPWKDI